MNCFKNKKILVTSVTGSLGKELVRHLLKNEQPETVRIYDVNETEQFEFQHELEELKTRSGSCSGMSATRRGWFMLWKRFDRENEWYEADALLKS